MNGQMSDDSEGADCSRCKAGPNDFTTAKCMKSGMDADNETLTRGHAQSSNFK